MQSIPSSYVLGIVLACVAAMLPFVIRALLGRMQSEIEAGTVSHSWLADQRRFLDEDR